MQDDATVNDAANAPDAEGLSWRRFALHAPGLVRDAVESALTGLGNPRYDKAAALRPNVTRQPLSDDERSRWEETSGIVRRCIHLVPTSALWNGWACRLDDTPEYTADLDGRLGLAGVLNDAWIYARRHGGSVSFAVTDDVARDSGNPREALTDGPHEVRAVHAYPGQTEANAMEWERDPASRDYRTPRSWMLTPRFSGSLEVDASRCAYMDGARTTPDRRYDRRGIGTSVLELYRDALTRHEGMAQSASGLAQAMSVQIMRLFGYNGTVGANNADGRRAVMSKIAEFARGLSSIGVGVLDAQDAFERHGMTAAGFGDLTATDRVALAEVEGIPQVILFADSPGGFSTDDEAGRRTYTHLVDVQRRLYAEPWLRRVYAIAYGEDVARRLVFDWGPVFVPTPVEMATLRLMHAQTDAQHIASGVLFPEEVRAARFEGDEYGDEIHVEEMDDEAASLAAELEEAATMAPDGQPAQQGAPNPTSPTPGGPDVQKLALNGAQVQALQAIVESVTAGTLPLAAAQGIVQAAFPDLTPEQVAAVFADVEEGSAEPAQSPVASTGAPNDDEPDDEDTDDG